MSEFTNNKSERVERLYRFCEGYLETSDRASFVKKNAEILKKTLPEDVIAVLDRLVKTGMDMEELKRFVNKLFNLLYEPLKDYPKISPPKGGIIDALIADNAKMEILAKSLKPLIRELNEAKSDKEKIKREIKEKLKELRRFKNHYLIIQNVLFPLAEKRWEDYRCVQIMWSFQDDAIKTLDAAYSELENENFDLKNFNASIARLFFLILPLKFREENVLFPRILETIGDKELEEAAVEAAQIGFPLVSVELNEKKDARKAEVSKGIVDLGTGALSAEQIRLIFNALPVDITFVDENDEVRYFSEPPRRVFPRTKAIIGRKIYDCHPPESYGVVEKIVSSFKNGEKDRADFWIDYKGGKVLIQYFAVRDENGVYKGVLEATQEVSDIMKLRGERRLLDWE